MRNDFYQLCCTMRDLEPNCSRRCAGCGFDRRESEKRKEAICKGYSMKQTKDGKIYLSLPIVEPKDPDVEWLKLWQSYVDVTRR